MYVCLCVCACNIWAQDFTLLFYKDWYSYLLSILLQRPEHLIKVLFQVLVKISLIIHPSEKAYCSKYCNSLSVYIPLKTKKTKRKTSDDYKAYKKKKSHEITSWLGFLFPGPAFPAASFSHQLPSLFSPQQPVILSKQYRSSHSSAQNPPGTSDLRVKAKVLVMVAWSACCPPPPPSLILPLLPTLFQPHQRPCFSSSTPGLPSSARHCSLHLQHLPQPLTYFIWLFNDRQLNVPFPLASLNYKAFCFYKWELSNSAFFWLLSSTLRAPGGFSRAEREDESVWHPQCLCVFSWKANLNIHRGCYQRKAVASACWLRPWGALSNSSLSW